ncbi:MAG: alanine racemase [Christensenellaceae bacterium]|jgi:alanine racemase|nr:alanine racemase [Christensenellaceae bacterium]
MNERTYVEINLNNLRHNVIAAMKKTQGCNIMAIVKAEAYGHGSVIVSQNIDDLVTHFGIAIPEEGIELRKAGITKPILILGIAAPDSYQDIIEYSLTASISTLEAATALSSLALAKGSCVPVHIAVDTGMSRIGFLISEMETISKLFQLKGIKVTGIFTHYACADETCKTYSKKQLHVFNSFLTFFKSNNLDVGIRHISNSAGIIEFDDQHFDMVRAGIMIYGLYPSKEVSKSFILKPVLSWIARISHIKTLRSGHGVSYGATHITTKETRIATIPIGYADGYPRALSSKGKVLINGKFAPILGRVCMDQFMVDVTEIDNVDIGTSVTLIGVDGDNSISVEDLADAAYSFNYEFVCGIAKRVPRKYIRN